MGEGFPKFGFITDTHYDYKYINKTGALDLEKAGLLAYAHGFYYTLGRQIGKFGFSVEKKKTRKNTQNIIAKSDKKFSKKEPDKKSKSTTKFSHKENKKTSYEPYSFNKKSDGSFKKKIK